MYAALLRAVNLGSHGKVAMPELRRLLAELGYTDVQTYLQSGNVVFAASIDDAAQIESDIEGRLAEDLGLETAVLVRTHDELDALVDGNPYLDRQDDPTKLFVAFLAETPDPARVAELDVPAGAPEEFSRADRDVYLHCPNGIGRAKLNNNYIERRLRVAATTRNWRTVTALRDLTTG